VVFDGLNPGDSYFWVMLKNRQKNRRKIFNEQFQTFPKKSFIKYFEMYELDIKAACKCKDIIFNIFCGFR
jgi:hypothetical protein